MTLPEHIALRLKLLKHDTAPLQLGTELYGFDIEAAPEVLSDFRVWAATRKRISQQQPGTFSRFGFETFLQTGNLMPRKWAAAQLGMNEQSFLDVLATMEQRMPHAMRVPKGSVLIGGNFVREFHTCFPSISGKIFRNINDKITRLHDALANELGLSVSPLFCSVSAALGKAAFASSFDSLTDSPVSPPYRAFLDTGKPLNLEPDSVSLLFLAEHLSDLRDLVYAGVFPPRFSEVSAHIGDGP